MGRKLHRHLFGESPTTQVRGAGRRVRPPRPAAGNDRPATAMTRLSRAPHRIPGPCRRLPPGRSSPQISFVTPPEAHAMPVDTADELTRILAEHQEAVAAARRAAAQRVHDDENTRHDCEAPLRDVALPLLREWSRRLAVEGYPTAIDDLLGCRPPALVFRLAPRGGPESSLTLACEPGPA